MEPGIKTCKVLKIVLLKLSVIVPKVYDYYYKINNP